MASSELIKQGYVDIQVNGYMGVDFNDPTTNLQQLQASAHSMLTDGVVSALPTVITAEIETMCKCIGNIVYAIENDSTCQQVFRGIHIEGPFFPAESGYIGAHPPQHALSSSPAALSRLLDCCRGHAKLITLAPEIDVDGNLTKTCVERGCVVSAGHTNASLADLQRCIDAGLSLFTHLGNGCPKLMDRHDNIIYRALKYRQQLCFTLIADSFHIPEMLFRLLLDWVDHSRLCVVSDAISATGLGPGTYQLGSRTVRIGADKAARDASGQHFVGAASSMLDADLWLAETLGLDQPLRYKLLVSNPARFGKL